MLVSLVAAPKIWFSHQSDHDSIMGSEMMMRFRELSFSPRHQFQVTRSNIPLDFTPEAELGFFNTSAPGLFDDYLLPELRDGESMQLRRNCGATKEEAEKQGSKNFLLLQQVVKNRERAQDVMQSPGAKVLYEMQNLSLGDRSESKSRVLHSVMKGGKASGKASGNYRNLVCTGRCRV